MREVFDALQARRRDVAERLVPFFVAKGLPIPRPRATVDVAT